MLDINAVVYAQKAADQAYISAWDENNPGRQLAASRKYTNAHREEITLKNRIHGRVSRPALRARALEALGGKCVVCGFDDSRALQIDHINGGGNKELATMGHKAIYRKIVAGGTEGYQLLCANHNWIKRAERGETSPRKD